MAMGTGQRRRPPVASDAELISRVRSGDQEAYGQLYDRHQQAARAAAHGHARREADVDDIVSDAFARVLATLTRGGGPDVAFRPYLLAAVRTSAIDRGRRSRDIAVDPHAGEGDEATIGPAATSTDEIALLDFERGTAATAFSRLPERWQAVLWHTEVEGLSPAEIAPIMGMSANAVAALSYRAREGLRQAYLQAHVAPTPDAGSCQIVRERLGAYVRDGLGKRERSAVEVHLEGCDDCRAIAAELSDVGTTLRLGVAPFLLGVPLAGYLASLLSSSGAATVAAGAAGVAATAGGSATGVAGTGVGAAGGAAAGGAGAGAGAAAGSGGAGVGAAAGFGGAGASAGPIAAGVAAVAVVAAAVVGFALTRGDDPPPEVAAVTSVATVAPTTPEPIPPPTTAAPTTAAPTTSLPPVTSPLATAPPPPPTTQPPTTQPPTTQPPTTAPTTDAAVEASTLGLAVAGERAFLVTTIVNRSGGQLRRPELQITTPPGARVLGVSESAWRCRGSAPTTCLGPTLDAGARSLLTITLDLAATPPGTYTVGIGLGSAEPGSTDLDPADNVVQTGLVVEPDGLAPAFATVGRVGLSVAANTVLSCPTGLAGCAEARAGQGPTAALSNNAWSMAPVDVDADPATPTSSRSVLTVPAGAEVVWAGLVWAADRTAGDGGAPPPTPSQLDRVVLTPPGRGAQPVRADRLARQGTVYQASADVTDVVRAAGAGSYQVAGVQVGTGADRFGGWALLVAYRSPALPERVLATFASLTEVAQGATSTIPLEGFDPAGSGGVDIGVVAYEGDLGNTGDLLWYAGSPVAGPGNPANDLWNSSVTDVGRPVTGVPGDTNHFGVDADLFRLGAGGGSPAFEFSTGGDRYLVGALAIVAPA